MPIPKIIYQTWKTTELHPNCIIIRDRIQQLNPNYKMVLYNDSDMDVFIRSNFNTMIYNCYLQLKVGATKADFWRYCILYLIGGVYLDIDSEITQSLDNLIYDDDSCIITREGNPGIFNNWMMIAEKGHPIFKNAIINCCRNILNKIPDVLYLTGPAGPFTEAIHQVMRPYYDNKNTHLYFEPDEKLNSLLNNRENSIRCRFFGVDWPEFAKWKHEYTTNLYCDTIHWQSDCEIFQNVGVAELFPYLLTYKFDKKIRCGVIQDGGYVFADLNDDYDCYISCGVSNEESFSRDFIEKYHMNEYNSFAFDGTIAGYPYEYTNKISFIRKNIGPINDNTQTNLSFLMERFDNIFLKIDIEGGEYPWLQQIEESQLSKFKQIVIEFHGITGDGWGASYDIKKQCLSKLAKTHFLVHVHANNYGPLVYNFPDVVELTYVRKSYFNETPPVNTQHLPIPGLDYPNQGTQDYSLNYFPFVNC